MEWLKEGMYVQFKIYTDIYKFKEKDDLKEEYFCYTFDTFDKVLYMFKPNEIDWEKTAELNGIVLEKQKYYELLKDNRLSEEQIKNKINEVFEEKYSPKYDEKKLDWSLLPIEQIEEIVKVLDYGKQKYAPNAWQGVEDAERRYLSATYRHLVEYQKGNKVDEESGLSHLSHLATNILFLMWFESNKGKSVDEFSEYCRTAVEAHSGLE